MAETLRRAQLHFKYSDLAEALQLPEGAVITSIEDDRESRTFTVLVMGSGEPVPDGTEPPTVPTRRLPAAETTT
jgi:hypothetical protein